MGPLTSGVGAVSDSCLPLDPFPIAGLPFLTSEAEDGLSPAAPCCARVGWVPMEVLPFSEMGVGGGAVRVGQGREEGEGCGQAVK